MQAQIYDNVYVVKDPTLKTVGQDGKLLSQTSIGYYTKIKADEAGSFMSFIQVEAWGKKAEEFIHQVRKGCKLTLTGYLFQKRWRDQEGKTRQQYAINIVSFAVVEQPKAKERTAAAQAEGPTFMSGTEDDDIPF